MMYPKKILTILFFLVFFIFFLLAYFFFSSSFTFLPSSSYSRNHREIGSVQLSKNDQYFNLLRENYTQEKHEAILIFVGDIMLDRGVKYMVERYGSGDYIFPFLKIKKHFEKADVLFGNLESIVSDKGTKMVSNPYSFRTKPEAISGLKYAGFNVLSVANNHIFDYGREAMEDSFSRLKNSAIEYIGGGFNEKEAYNPLIKEVKGNKIAFLAYTNLGSPKWKAENQKSGIAWLEKERMEKEIKNAKNLADIVIVSFHYGTEYKSEPDDSQILISRAAVDAGADLIVGHHPHVVQKAEQYKNAWIFYSLGNFIFDQSFSKETMQSQMIKVTIKNGKIEKVIQIPIRINSYLQPYLL